MDPDVHSLTGAYAVDALDPEERRAFEAHLADCESCREEVAGFHETTAMLGSAVAEPPPARLRDSVLAEVARTRQEAPAAEPVVRPGTVSNEPRRHRSLMDRLLLPVAAAMAVALVAMAFVVGDLNRRLDERTATVAVADVVAAADLQTWETEVPGGGTARVLYSASRGEGWFVADGMAPAEPGKAYELWTIDDTGPSPAGLFDAREGRVLHSFTGEMDEVTAMAVTVEPESGSPAPTSDPLVVLEL